MILYVGEFASLEIGEIVNLQVGKPVGLMRLWVRKLMKQRVCKLGEVVGL